MTKPAPGPDQPPVPVRLVTFNIHHGVGDDGRHDLPRLAQVLAAADADVICLQEVDRHFGPRSEDVDQALLLARALDMQLAWGPAIDEPRRRASRAASTATRCSRACRSWSATCTGCPGAGEPRSALRTMIELDGAALWVTVTHLSRSGGDRAAQLAARGRAAHRTDGDRRRGRRLQHHTGRARAGRAAGAVRRRLGAGARPRRPRRAGGSGSTTTGNTHPARSPHRRIDQAWVTPGSGSPRRRSSTAAARRTTCR